MGWSKRKQRRKMQRAQARERAFLKRVLRSRWRGIPLAYSFPRKR